MSIKKVRRLEEGPMDFIRGAGKEAGRKLANSGIGRAVGDVVTAGKAASAEGDQRKVEQLADQLRKEVAMLGYAISAYDEQQGIPQDENPEGEQSQNDMPADNGQQPEQQQKDNVQQKDPSGEISSGGVAKAFQSTKKDRRGVFGKGGQDFQWSFDSYLHLLHNTDVQLDEGAWDFIRGAGKEAVTKVQGQINKYAQGPSVIKDLYHAGAKASEAGDIKNKALKHLKSVIAMVRKMGPQGEAAVKQAVATLPKERQRRVGALIMKNLRPQQTQTQAA